MGNLQRLVVPCCPKTAEDSTPEAAEESTPLVAKATQLCTPEDYAAQECIDKVYREMSMDIRARLERCVAKTCACFKCVFVQISD